MNNPERYPEDSEGDLFELVKRLGNGGFATTFHARVVDEEWIEEYGTEHVALKVPFNKKNRIILHREIQLNAALYLRLQELSSINLCRYLGFNIYGGKPVMVMEFCSEGSLKDKLGQGARKKRLSAAEASTIAQGVLRGLAVIHEERIFHRDIKPENILFVGETPKVADLGISRVLASNQKAGTQIGTPEYMSPEVLTNEGGSFSSDIWSLGVTLYEMVTGRLPFGDRDTVPLMRLCKAICNDCHRPACDLCDDVPEWLSVVIDKALQKAPSERFSCAEEMIEALALAGTKPRLKPVTKVLVVSKKEPEEIEKAAARIRELIASGVSSVKVETEIHRLIQQHPGAPMAYHCAGECYNRCQLHRQAAQAFQKGIEIDPSNGLLHWDLAIVCQVMGEKQDAEKHFEQALACDLDPGLKQHAVRLLKALKEGRGVNALSPVAPTTEPVSKETQTDFAEVVELLHSGRTGAQVEEKLCRFVEKYRSNPRAYQYLGEYYNRCQLHEAAVEAFQKGLLLEEKDALLNWDIALAHQRLGNRTEAIRHLEKAIEWGLDAGLRQHANVLLRTLRAV